MRFDDDADSILQHAIADGDSLALADLYDRYAAALMALAQAMLGPGVEAETLVHDLFLEVWRHAAQPAGRDGHGQGGLRTWLFVRMRLRCLQARQERPEQFAGRAAAPLLPPHWRPRGRYELLCDRHGHLAPLRLRVHGVLGELGQDVRHCLQLIFLEGLTVPELARRTCSTQRAVMGRLAQAQCALDRGLRGNWP